MNTEDGRNRPKNRRRIYLFIFKKFTILMREKYPLLQQAVANKTIHKYIPKKMDQITANQKREISDNLVNKF